MSAPVSPTPEGADFQAIVAAIMKKRHEAIETMCERMLVLDRGGVLVTDEPLGAFTVELSADVPWGEIHYVEGRHP